MNDTFWAQQRAIAASERSSHADPSACGTCRSNAEASQQVEHDECAQHATLLQAPDHPHYELLAGLSLEEKAKLPARFHIPVFDDWVKPNAWLCAVCWEEGHVVGWPCATATKYGTQVFSPLHEAETVRKRQAARIAELETAVPARVVKTAVNAVRNGEIEQPEPANWREAGCAPDCTHQHTYTWGRCALAPASAKPEAAVSMSKVYTDPEDGLPSIGYDSYTVPELGELITAGLRASDLPVNGDDLVDVGLVAAHAIVHRNDGPADGTRELLAELAALPAPVVKTAVNGRNDP
jgi:hypothetical protein